MQTPSEKSGGAARWGLLLVVATVVNFVLGGLCVNYYFRKYPPPSSQTADKAPAANTEQSIDMIPALGRIEPMDGILHLGVPAPDRIRKILVEEGKHVASGERLVELESEALHQLQVESAEIEQREATTRLDATKKSGLAQIEVEKLRVEQTEKSGFLENKAQESKIKFLESQVANTARDYDRLRRTGDSIASQQIDKQWLLWQQAQEELAAAKTQLDKMISEHPLDVKLAKARLTSAQAELVRGETAISLDQLTNQTKQARERNNTSRIVAPSDGTILRILAQKGDLVQGKPIVQMANLDNMIVVAEVPISYIPCIEIGDLAKITSSVFKKLGSEEAVQRGKVYFIRHIVGKPQVLDPDPLVRVDYRIVEVKILLDKSEPAAHYIGHEVSVLIEPRKKCDSEPRADEGEDGR